MQQRGMAFRRSDTPPPDAELADKVLFRKARDSMEREIFKDEFKEEHPLGKIYDKKPFKMLLEAGKRYSWCTCGLSKNQVGIIIEHMRPMRGGTRCFWDFRFGINI